jgi:hypothetical protein
MGLGLRNKSKQVIHRHLCDASRDRRSAGRHGSHLMTILSRDVQRATIDHLIPRKATNEW